MTNTYKSTLRIWSSKMKWENFMYKDRNRIYIRWMVMNWVDDAPIKNTTQITSVTTLLSVNLLVLHKRNLFVVINGIFSNEFCHVKVTKKTIICSTFLRLKIKMSYIKEKSPLIFLLYWLQLKWTIIKSPYRYEIW